MGTCFETWNSEDFHDYNFGLSDMDAYDFCKPPSKRTRKVTITEITDELDFLGFDENDLDIDLNADDLHKSFENVIEDWKIKMEVIIGDGLKKLRKSNKERRLMMKYLPGDKKLQEAKIDIAKEWKIDFQKAFGTTHKKLEKLAGDKTKEVEVIAKTEWIKDKEINKNKKRVVNIKFNDTDQNKTKSSFGNLKELIRELDRMCNILQGESPTIHSIPIYSKEARGQLLPAYNNEWLDLQRNMLYHKDINIYLNNRQSFLDVLEDFKIKFYNTKDKIKKTSGARLDETNVVKAQTRMLERKFKKEEHLLKQFKKNGQDRFLIIKKKMSNDDNVSNEQPADIFKDWKYNLDSEFEQRKKAAIAARKTTTRKLSNRALRKELLKAIDEDDKKRPMSYSDIVKKNLKLPMEDIFEAWRDYLQELDDILSDESRTSFSKGDSMEDILGTAMDFQQELQKCGQPTVRTVNKIKKSNQPWPSRIMNYDKEIFFASWRHNLTNLDDENNENDYYQVSKNYEAENHFSKWKHNLRDETIEEDEDMKQAEDIFEDWIYNFHANELSRSPSGSGSKQMLKNKQRQQRRSKKKSKSPM